MGKLNRFASCLACLTMLLGSGFTVVAGRIDPAGFRIYDYSGGALSNATFLAPPANLHIVFSNQTAQGVDVSQGAPDSYLGQRSLTNLTDNDPGTFITLSNSPVLLMDLGQTSVIDRVCIIGTTNRLEVWPNWSSSGTNPPLGLVVVFVGDTATNTNQVAAFTVPYDAGNPVDTEVDLRFSPAAGRYVRLELQTQVAWGANYWPGYGLASQPPPATNLAWNLGEVELYGFTGASATQTNVNAVVLPVGAAAPLVLAASDLSYYLGELTGSPHPIISPANTNQFSGTLYTIVDLKPLAPNYATMMANIAAGLLPNNVNVVAQGRQVLFSAWPYRCVLWSVWEFLERQGVRWLYPDAHGDYVPHPGMVNLSMLPLQFTPSATSIYANFDAASFEPWPPWQMQSLRQGYLYVWRNHFNGSWNAGPIGGAEIPYQPATGIPLSTNYAEGFDGYPHNFNSVIPQWKLLQNSNWWGYDPSLGYRVNPTQSGAPMASMDDPSLIAWVAAKALAYSASYPIPSRHPLNLIHFNNALNLLPQDAVSFCQCPGFCAPSNAPDALTPDSVPWVKKYSTSFSGEYYSFVDAVARQVAQTDGSILVGCLNYADVFLPPNGIGQLSGNVQVELVLYGAPNLPITAPYNLGLKQALDTWHSKASHLAHYDYALLHTDVWQPDPRVPVPLVAGIIDRANYLNSLGALNGGTQATLDSLPYDAVNYWVWPRIRWNVTQQETDMLNEFFTGYYLEAAQPMLNYYTTLENATVSNNVNLHTTGYCYGTTIGSYPLTALSAMQSNLIQAGSLATNWITRQRVSDASNGFYWVLQNKNLIGTNLNDLSWVQTVPSGGAYSVILSNMVRQPNRPQGNYVQWNANQSPGSNYWTFLAQGTIMQTLNFQQGGTCQVTVTARQAFFSTNGPPIMEVYLGGNVGWAAITNSYPNWANYTFTLTAPPQDWDVSINFWQNPHGSAFDVAGIAITFQ